MANKKQRQQQQAAARRINIALRQQQDQLTKYHAKILQAAELLSREITAAVVDVAEPIVETLHNEFVRDYALAGESCRPFNLNDAQKYAALGCSRYVIFKLKGDVVGFVQLVRTHTADPNWMIELCYVREQYRGRHVATIQYLIAISQHNASKISISYGRVSGHCGYWNALGFDNIVVKSDQRGTSKGLCYLVRSDNFVQDCLIYELLEPRVSEIRSYLEQQYSKLLRRSNKFANKLVMAFR